MQLLGKLEIRERAKIIELLDIEHVGRLATLDTDGFPQVIPMNFVFLDGAIYMHSHIRGEKLENITADGRAGFEIDHEYEFLPSYFEDEHDASLADTLYYSVVIKGTASLIDDKQEKCRALGGLMTKYQPEGRYDPITEQNDVLDAVTVIRIEPKTMRGKYKIGQHLGAEKRTELAQQILERNLPTAHHTLKAMGFESDGTSLRSVRNPLW